MRRSFWFRSDLPVEFGDPAIKEALSFNGQLHFKCDACQEITWGDITFAKSMVKGREGFPCASCRKNALKLIKFAASDSRVCQRCGTESYASPEEAFQCSLCGHGEFVVSETVIRPTYPKRLFLLYGRREPLGDSVKDDVDFISSYIRALRMSPQFHETCIHLVAFIESLFEQVYGSSPEATDLMNLASGLMRTIYRETGDLDAAYLSIALMAEARDLTLDPIRRAVYGFNINQNVYSVLAKRDDKSVSLRFRFDLKQYGASLSRETLAAFEAINEDWLGELRAKQKWLLGDILKAGDPSEGEIDEALHWFDAALKDPALPGEVADYVRESSLTARSKRRVLTPQQRQELQTSLHEIESSNLDRAEGLQRIISFTELLRGQFRSGNAGDLKAFAKQSLGEGILYVAANDPRNMLRHGGSVVSRLVAGFAAERFHAGAPIEAMAGVEAFRSLAIQRPESGTKVSRDSVSELELQLMVGRLFGTKAEPSEIADEMESKYRERLNNNIHALLDGDLRSILWMEVWDGDFLFALMQMQENRLAIRQRVEAFSIAEAIKAFSIPMADSSPGRLRARQLEVALSSGSQLIESVIADSPRGQELVFIGPSSLGGWPIDASEVLFSKTSNSLRPITFAPSIEIASRMHTREKARRIETVLLVSYGGADLKCIKQEIMDIASIYGSRLTVLDGAVAQKFEVLNALSEPFDVIHFCGHGSFDYLQPMQSRIYFNDRGEEEGSIAADDILSCGLAKREPIVVLSACTSALVLPNGSNNFLGLAGAFIRTGASSIVGARWPISDNVAALFSKHCHAKLAEGESVAGAVAYAKERLRDFRSDEWVAFMKIGG